MNPLISLLAARRTFTQFCGAAFLYWGKGTERRKVKYLDDAWLIKQYTTRHRHKQGGSADEREREEMPRGRASATIRMLRPPLEKVNKRTMAAMRLAPPTAPLGKLASGRTNDAFQNWRRVKVSLQWRNDNWRPKRACILNGETNRKGGIKQCARNGMNVKRKSTKR